MQDERSCFAMTTVYGPELGLAYKTCTMTEAGQHMSLDKPVTNNLS